ncbi:hypothetical protein C8F04DRAFT_1306476 [Mycena alexandri]|uniref:Uncharacterized protein n=1 Tax=Mycena alexandri TaxID=1745969 RepID=A0AAD6WQ59_9AGAR|nr:hypothetical protein C8F04DRAFT_1306476 [Mycena alexandri]
MDVTPGLQTILARAWAGLLDHAANLVSLKPLVLLLTVLVRCLELPRNFDEIVSGAGGGYDDLASVAVRQISYAQTSGDVELKVNQLSLIIQFVQLSSKHPGFAQALLNKGFIAALVSALNTLAGTTTSITRRIIKRGLSLLTVYLVLPPMYPWISEAVRAGLLRFIISCAVKYSSGSQEDEIYRDLGWILFTLVPQSRISDVAVSTFVEECVEVLDSWESMGRPWAAACNNTMVPHLPDISTIANYSPSAAQSRPDENSNAARDARALSTALPNASVLIGVRATEKPAELYIMTNRRYSRHQCAFIRAMLDADYKRSKFQISCDIVLFMYAHPHPSAPDIANFYVQFDYTYNSGRVVATVLPRSDLQRELSASVFATYRGMRLHTILFAPPSMPEKRQFVYPLRVSSSTFDEGLRAIASEIPAGADVFWYKGLVEHKVRTLMETEGKVVEIH